MENRHKNFKELTVKWILRFIKFNIVGFAGFLLGTAIFVLAFSSFGEWTWLIASAAGGILQFVLISILNKTKKGKIFDSFDHTKQQSNEA
jgi:putative flippase GtrA